MKYDKVAQILIPNGGTNELGEVVDNSYIVDTDINIAMYEIPTSRLLKEYGTIDIKVYNAYTKDLLPLDKDFKLEIDGIKYYVMQIYDCGIRNHDLQLTLKKEEV